MDKQSLVIIAFVVIFAISASILAMGTVPEIFKTSQKTDVIGVQLNESLIFQHEDAARQQQTKHEDEAREKQNILDNLGRDKQRYQIINETNASLNDLEKRLIKFMKESENRSEIANQQRQETLDNLQQFISDSVNRSQIANLERDKIQDDVTKMQKKLNNIISETKNMLDTYGKSSVNNHKNMNSTIAEIDKKLDRNSEQLHEKINGKLDKLLGYLNLTK